jgi:hypothetical protein
LPSAEWQREYRARRKALGICWTCGGSKPVEEPYGRCAGCRGKRAAVDVNEFPPPKAIATCRSCPAVLRDCPVGGRWCAGWVDLAGFHRGAGHAHRPRYGERVSPLRGRS